MLPHRLAFRRTLFNEACTIAQYSHWYAFGVARATINASSFALLSQSLASW